MLKSEPVRIEDLDDFEYAVLKAQGECKVLGHSMRAYKDDEIGRIVACTRCGYNFEPSVSRSP